MTRTVRRTVMTRVPTFARTFRRTVTGRPAARARRAAVGSVTVTLMRLLFVSVRLTGFSLILSGPETAVPLTEIWHLEAQVTVPVTVPRAVYCRALAVKVAPRRTVPPAVVAFGGASAVVARAGVVAVPVGV